MYIYTQYTYTYIHILIGVFIYIYIYMFSWIWVVVYLLWLDVWGVGLGDRCRSEVFATCGPDRYVGISSYDLQQGGQIKSRPLNGDGR